MLIVSPEKTGKNRKFSFFFCVCRYLGGIVLIVSPEKTGKNRKFSFFTVVVGIEMEVWSCCVCPKNDGKNRNFSFFTAVQGILIVFLHFSAEKAVKIENFLFLLIELCDFVGGKMVCNIFIFFLLASSIERHSDSPFPSQKASVRISATHIADVLLLAEDVAAKHESPDLSPGPAILDGKAIDSTWLAHVDEL